MRVFVIACWLLLCWDQPLFSQQSFSKRNTGVVMGRIMDQATQQPLAYATISIFSLQDSTLVSGGLTNEQGQFKLRLPFGRYYLHADFLAYQPLIIPAIVVSKKQRVRQMGNLLLSVDVTTLEAVEVKGQQSEIRMTLDRKVFTVGKDLTSAGGDASEVLGNVPSVSIDEEGNVSLRGKQGVRILVDGRPSGLMNLDASQGLKSIPAQLIDRVEVITNPSARYAAESIGGLINIVLKKEKGVGLNGQLSLHTAYPLGYGAGVNLNWRKKQFNFFGGLNYRYQETPRSGDVYQEILRRDTLFLTEQEQDLDIDRNNFSLNVGMDYQWREKNMLTAGGNYNRSDTDLLSRLSYEDYRERFTQPLGTSFRTGNQPSFRDVAEYHLSYVRQLQTPRQTLSFDARVQRTYSLRESDLFESPSLFNHRPAAFSQRSEDESDAIQWIAQLDYTHPFSEKGKLETGVRASIREIDNVFFVEELENDQWNRLENISNDLRYEEYIYAAYALYGNQVDRWSYQLGLRLEASDVTTALDGGGDTDSVNQRTYLNIFPSAAITYQLSDQHAIQLSYSRRLKRPSLLQLRPFVSYNDRRNLSSGNPNLDPEYANTLELAYIRYWEKATLSSAIFYRRANQFVERIRTLDGDGVFISRPENIGYQNAYGLEFTMNWRPYSWWQISGDVNLYYAEIDGNRISQGFNAETFSTFGRLSSTLTFWKKLRLQLRYNHRSPRNNPQGQDKGLYNVDAALSIPVLRDKGSLSLRGRNILNTYRWQWHNQGPDFYNEGTYVFVVPSVRLTFSYQMNHLARRNRIRNKSAAEYGDGETY